MMLLTFFVFTLLLISFETATYGGLKRLSPATAMLTTLCFLGFTQIAIAQDGTVDVVSYEAVFKMIIEYVQNRTTLKGVTLAALAIFFVTQVFKTKHLSEWFEKRHPLIKRLIITCLGVLYGVVNAIAKGSSTSDAIVEGLIGSQGAMLIWTNVKPFLPKKEK